ncbi:SDR family oxidoreductase [Aeromicrobium ginsengisoli]|uniref:SDR family oxidoreductase n=1 Tax=Aeromicrobium ginsengisoli TaxID=363867 RepID=A0A5M4FFD2_9ACTN|nr:SDR family oxidoreductase [Aeromicrobium ginsengisoli]KAA1397826.1 SDR family oxidoreductase [Aeromicrobium ginsengisoli]
MKTSLKGKTVVVTGAARGIGEHVARLAAERGARVGLIGLEPDRLRSLALELGPSTEWREVDVRNSNDLKSAIDDCAAALGGIDFLVANAGVVAYGTIRQTEDTSFERVLDVNVNGVFRTLKHATPHLQRSRGHVAVIASALSFLALPSMSSYGASKAAVEALGLTYRQEVAHLGISVSLVHPSWIDTDLVRGAEADLPSFRKLRDGLPYPGNVTTTVNQAADAIVRGLERRQRRVYVPRAVVGANVAQGLVNSSVMWPWFRRFAGKAVPNIEREVDALGRQDQIRT